MSYREHRIRLRVLRLRDDRVVELLVVHDLRLAVVADHIVLAFLHRLLDFFAEVAVDGVVLEDVMMVDGLRRVLAGKGPKASATWVLLNSFRAYLSPLWAAYEVLESRASVRSTRGKSLRS